MQSLNFTLIRLFNKEVSLPKIHWQANMDIQQWISPTLPLLYPPDPLKYSVGLFFNYMAMIIIKLEFYTTQHRGISEYSTRWDIFKPKTYLWYT